MATTLNESSVALGGSRAAYTALLKEFYGQMWDDAIHTSNEFTPMVATKKQKMGGRRTIVAVATGLTQSAGITTVEGAPLPNPRVGTWANPELISRGTYSRLRWTVEAEAAARAGDKGMWSRPRQQDVKQAQETMKINLERKFFNGYADILGVVASHAAGSGVSVITLQNRDSRTFSGAAYWYRGKFHMRVGMELGLIPTANGALGNPSADITDNARAARITALGGTNSAPTITLHVNASGASYFNATPAAGDFLVPIQNRRASVDADAGDAISDFSSFNGFANLASDATHYSVSMGLSKTTYPNMAGVVDANGGTVRAFSEHMVMLFVDRVADEGTGDTFSDLVLNRATRREVVLEHDGDRRYGPVLTTSGFGKQQAKVGEKTIPYNALWQCPTHLIHGIDKSTFGWAELLPMGPVDNVPERWVADYPSHEQIWQKHGNVYCDRAYANGTLDDISTSVYSLSA